MLLEAEKSKTAKKKQVVVTETEDSEIEEDTSPGGRKMKDRFKKEASQEVAAKVQLGKSLSSTNIVTKNGYLFLKRNSSSVSKRNEENFEDCIPKNEKEGVRRASNASNSNSNIQIYNNKRSGSIQVKVAPKFLNRYRYFQSLHQYSLEQPCINIASKYVGSEHEVYRLQDIENKKKWISKKDFQTHAGTSIQNVNDNFKESHYVTADPSKPPMLHQFRD